MDEPVRVKLHGGPLDGGEYEIPRDPDGGLPSVIQVAMPDLPIAELLGELMGDDEVDIEFEGMEAQPDVLYERGVWSEAKRKEKAGEPYPYLWTDLANRFRQQRGEA
jgi:hypothetical protein